MPNSLINSYDAVMVIKVRKQSIYSEPQLKGTYIISVEKIQIEK